MTEQFYVDDGKKSVMISRAKNDPAMVILAYTNADHGTTEAMLLKDIVADGNTCESVTKGYNDLPPLPLGKEQGQLNEVALELITLRVLYGAKIDRIKKLEGALRKAAAQHGQGIDLPAGLSVSNTGAGVTEKWNSAKLNELSKLFPAINEARTQGIRNAGGRVLKLNAVAEQAEINIGADFFDYFFDDLAMAENIAIERLVGALTAEDEEFVTKDEMITLARRHAALSSYKQAETDEATTRAVADRLGIPADTDVVGYGLEGIIAAPEASLTEHPPASDLDIDAGVPELGAATLTQQPPDSAPTGGEETEKA